MEKKKMIYHGNYYSFGKSYGGYIRKQRMYDYDPCNSRTRWNGFNGEKMEKKEISIGLINPQGYLRDNKLHRGGVSPTILAENDKIRVLKRWIKTVTKSES